MFDEKSIFTKYISFTRVKDAAGKAVFLAISPPGYNLHFMV
jgi:hypothetical protein